MPRKTYPNITRRCAQCGATFAVKSNNPKQKYCCIDCRSAAQRDRITVYCAYCGKPKEVARSNAEHYDKHYCDMRCLGADRVGTEPANKIGMTKVCPICGTTFNCAPSTGQQFCSKKCADKANGERQRLAPRKVPAVQRTCEQCGKAFEIKPSALNRSGYTMGRFCSRACQVEHKRHIRGEAHPLRVQYVQLTCQWCGKTYELKPSIAKTSKFCSRHCQGAWSAKNMSRKETTIEAAIRSLLDQMGVTYIQECPIDFYTCDFVIESSRLVIECDGTYWHSIDKVFRRDKKKDKLLTSKGYRVLRLPESRIKSDLEWCRQEIIKSL